MQCEFRNVFLVGEVQSPECGLHGTVLRNEIFSHKDNLCCCAGSAVVVADVVTSLFRTSAHTFPIAMH